MFSAGHAVFSARAPDSVGGAETLGASQGVVYKRNRMFGRRIHTGVRFGRRSGA